MLHLLKDDFVKVVKYIQEAPSFVYSVLEGICNEFERDDAKFYLMENHNTISSAKSNDN